MRKNLKRYSTRVIRHLRIRKRVVGSTERPRLALCPSLKHLEVQLVDDHEQKTLLGFTTKAKEFKKAAGLNQGGNIAAAVSFGKYVAQKAKEKGVEKVVFDRGGFLYHGRVKAFADAARQGGLIF